MRHGAPDGSGLRFLIVGDGEPQSALRRELEGEAWVERVDTAPSDVAAERLATRLRPHVAVLAVVDGATSRPHCQRLLRACEETAVLVLGAGSPPAAGEARAAGASGFVPREWAARDLARAARIVALGATVFPAAPPEPPRDRLSGRELAVLRLMASGATNPEIAERLYLSPHTVKDHTTALYRKLGARNRADAVARAQRRGLLE
jgi:DNA-binding NarL/FixJ family response regulator